MSNTKMRFETNADAALDKARATYATRGGEYGDTWNDARWLAMLATAKKLGIPINNDQCRKLAAAALVDVKYWRQLGGWKDDSVIDMIAYTANWLSEVGE